jgi:hypothetical protein
MDQAAGETSDISQLHPTHQWIRPFFANQANIAGIHDLILDSI